MDDREIVALYWERSQTAIEETQKQYGEKLRRLAENLLGNFQDAEECVNDACLGAWNSIPPSKPDPLLPYLYRIVRNQALNRRRSGSAQKRGGGGFDAALEELEAVLVSPTGSPEQELDAKELGQVLDGFLRRLTHRDRVLFLGRYWYGEAYDTLALWLGISENACAARVSRTRKKLKTYLIKKGAL